MSDKDNFPIVGIGASAGGIEALEGFFRGLPRDAGAALVIITISVPTAKACFTRSSPAIPICRFKLPVMGRK
jgi:chemotaxis response regulator CheB